MKLNEGRLIAEVLKLASEIKAAKDRTVINSCADGIISICNIVDISQENHQVVIGNRHPKSGLLQWKRTSDVIDDSQDLFEGAKEEQQGGSSSLK